MSWNKKNGHGGYHTWSKSSPVLSINDSFLLIVFWNILKKFMRGMEKSILVYKIQVSFFAQQP